MATSRTACTPTGSRRAAHPPGGCSRAHSRLRCVLLLPCPCLLRQPMPRLCPAVPDCRRRGLHPPLFLTRLSPQVDRVIARRTRHGRRQYLVKWRGLGYAEATWESGAALKGDRVRGCCPAALLPGTCRPCWERSCRPAALLRWTRTCCCTALPGLPASHCAADLPHCASPQDAIERYERFSVAPEEEGEAPEIDTSKGAPPQGHGGCRSASLPLRFGRLPD